MATWTKTEEDALLAEIKTIKSIYEIAKKHNRTPNAIHSRLHRILSRSVLTGTPCPVKDIKAFLTPTSHREGQQLTLPMMFQQTFTREKLQNLAEEHRLRQLAHFIDSQVANGVVCAATQGRTSFLYEGSPHYPQQQTPTNDELMTGLRLKFPGTTVSLSEEWVDVAPRHPHLPLTRVLKKGIKIDWS